MRILFVTRGGAARGTQQNVPRADPAKKTFPRSFLARYLDHGKLRTAANFQKNGANCLWIEGAHRIVIGKLRKETRYIGRVCRKSVPPIAISVVDDGAGSQDFLH